MTIFTAQHNAAVEVCVCVCVNCNWILSNIYIMGILLDWDRESINWAENRRSKKYKPFILHISRI